MNSRLTAISKIWSQIENYIRHLKRIHFAFGLKEVVLTITDRVIRPTTKNKEILKRNLQNKKGLEIGGPTKLFKDDGPIPVYCYLSSLDNCNYAKDTVWEGEIKNGNTFKYLEYRQAGEQYICECTDLGFIQDASYDCILSSHTIEHVANPIKALLEWKRVLKVGGNMLIVFPHMQYTFDRFRSRTTIDHIISDYTNNIEEDDLTHLDEIVRLHDIILDPAVKDRNFLKQRCNQNFKSRCIHHHVFDTLLAVELVSLVGLKIIFTETVRPYNIIILCEKTAEVAKSIAKVDKALLKVWIQNSKFSKDDENCKIQM